MKAHDIFTPGKLPTWTYVDDHLQSKGQQLLDALEDGTTLVSISGPSKSGKTVFVEHLIGENNLGAFHLSYEVVKQPKVTGCAWNGSL